MEIRILRECVILFLCFLQMSRGKHKKEKYCDYTKNVYYSEPMGGCKKCDPCFIGSGLVDKIDISDIDSEKGALLCRVCRPCQDGFFQKRHKAFRNCKKCKACRIPGQYEVRKCTATQNRKCKNIKYGGEDTLPTISKLLQEPLMTTGNTPMQNLMTPALIRQNRIETPSSTPKTQELVAVKDFHENKIAFISMAVLATVAFTSIFGFIVRKCVQKRHAQQTVLKETMENERGQENTDDGFETSRNTDPNTETIDIEELDPPESENKRREDTLAVCKHNRSKERCQNLDSSMPLLRSTFSYNFPDTPRVSNLNQTNFKDSGMEDGIRMVSENITSISDVSDSERCDTPTSGLGESDVTNDGSSCYYVSTEEDEKHLTEAELQTVAHRLAPDFFKRVGRELGVTDNEIRIIQANHSDVEDRAYEVLKKWTEKKAPLATKKTLKDALVKVGRRDVVATFYNEAKELQKL